MQKLQPTLHILSMAVDLIRVRTKRTTVAKQSTKSIRWFSLRQNRVAPSRAGDRQKKTPNQTEDRSQKLGPSGIHLSGRETICVGALPLRDRHKISLPPQEDARQSGERLQSAWRDTLAFWSEQLPVPQWKIKVSSASKTDASSIAISSGEHSVPFKHGGLGAEQCLGRML